MMGCALSGVGALIGAAAWSGIAIVTNYEIGYIAWGLGVLAGLGMWIGYKEGNLRAGLTASVIALVGIVAAKATTFIYVNYPEISEARKVVATLKDEYVHDRDRLASHRALLKEMQNGLVPYSEKAEAAYDEAYFELVNTPPSELQAELAKLDTWEASEKWSDPKFVRNFVVYEFTNEAIRDSRHEQEDEDDGYPDIDARQWRTQRSDAIKEVDAMTPDEQLERAKTIENNRKRRTNTLRLAGHDAMIESLTMPPSESETLYSEFYEDRKIHYEDMSDDEFSEAVAMLDAWEKDGKWDDADYVKDQSTYNRVNDAISKRNEDLPDDADYWAPTDEQWQELVDTATDDVNLMTHDQRAGKLKRTQREQEQKLEEIIAKFQQESADELADALADELTGHAFEFFVANSFGGMDLLFLVLAVGSAFKIATRGSEKD